MTASRVRIALGLLLVGSATLALAAPAAATHAPTLIALSENSTIYVGDPRTDGTFIIWRGGSTSVQSTCDTLFGARLADREPFQVATLCGGGDYELDDGVVAWATDAGDVNDDGVPDVAAGVFVEHLATGLGETLATDVAVDVTLAGELVAWIAVEEEGDGFASTIKLRQRGTAATETIATFDSDTVSAQLRINDAWVYWLEGAPDAPATRLMRAQPGDEPQEVRNGQMAWYDVFGGRVVFWGGDVLAVENIVTSDYQQIANHVDGAPSSDGRYIFWMTAEYPTRLALLGYDLQTASLFTAYEEFDYDEPPTGTIANSRIADDVLVWDRRGTRAYMTEVHAAPLLERLPSAARPDLAITTPEWTFYPETGHYLQGGFRRYWTQSGGLPVFGYPLTEEFTQHRRPAQYFERQRFEWHPEFAGTPYDVLLGLLGTEDAAARGLLDDPAFQREDDEPPVANGLYFDETGHWLAGAFRTYWESHGLEFGDVGITYRESLALFGNPISAAFTDPATGLTIQYFERAVFELHPENAGTEFEVLLRRLGAEALAAQGWM